MSDKQRFLDQLRKGPVAAVDFLAPNVIDGGKPITRLAARKYDLVQDGHDVRDVGVKNGCSVYAWFGMLENTGPAAVETTPDPPAPDHVEAAPTLFDLPDERSPYRRAA